MIINDLEMNQDSVFRDIQCKMSIKQKIIAKNGRVEMMGDNQFKFILKDNVIDFSIVDKNAAKLIMDFFNRHFFCLANVTVCNDNNGENKVFFVHMGFFYNFQRWGKTPVIISDEIKEKIEKRCIKGRQSLEQVLEENFKLSDGVSNYFAYTSGKFYFGDEEKVDGNIPLDNVTEEEQQEENSKVYNSEAFERAKEKEKQKKDSLVIYGREFCIYASIQGEKFDSKLIVEKIAKRKNNIPMMRISEGTLEFFDHTSIMSKKVKETLESTKGYLDLWNQYAEQEGKILLDKVRKVGLITLHRVSATYDNAGIHVPYTNLSKEAEEYITNDCYLFFSDEIPVYLSDSEMTWTDYRTLSKEASTIGYSINKGVQVRVCAKKNGGVVLAPKDGILPDMKYVSLSILGDESQIIRREDARHRIMMGEAANPALGLIFEGQLTEELGNYSNRKKIMPLSAFVKEKIFAHEPTETQKRAIEIALNTPDIAIIQGPPGTGKTTVITAIIERLNEICDKREKVNGQVLITSFQHDAVRNVIERLRINSLPTIKFGKQEHGGEEDLTRERLIEEWCEDYISLLNEKNPELIETEQRNRLSTLHNIYLAYPSDKNALEFLMCAKEVNSDVELDKRISRMIEVRNVNDSDSNSQLITLIRRIRTTKEGFLDDGADNADNLLQNLEDMGINQLIPENKKVFDILDNAALCYGKEPAEELLKSLKEAKTYLLEKCIPKPSYKKDVPDEEITTLYKILNQSVKKHDDEKSAILADMLKELRSNRSEVERSLEHYIFVYSATTQQSEGREIKEAKGIVGRHTDEHPEYETVIVDEAARVSPADLMIPLAQAKKRIILVGDHRQLPHIYDEEVFESMKENGESVDMNNIKKSMFEYLLEKAKELEKIDNVPRTIVLDAQYRMHPMLGEFVNEVFYKPHNEHFSSPLPAKNYAQYVSKKSLPVLNKSNSYQCLSEINYQGKTETIALYDSEFLEESLFSVDVNDVSFAIEETKKGRLKAIEIHNEEKEPYIAPNRYFAKGMREGNIPPMEFVGGQFYLALYKTFSFANNRSLDDRECPIELRQAFSKAIDNWVEFYNRFDDKVLSRRILLGMSLMARDIGKVYYDLVNEAIDLYGNHMIKLPDEVGCGLGDLSTENERNLLNHMLADLPKEKMVFVLSKALWHNKDFLKNVDTEILLDYFEVAIEQIRLLLQRYKLNMGEENKTGKIARDIGVCMEYILGVFRLRELEDDVINKKYLSLNNKSLRNLYEYLEEVIDLHIQVCSFLLSIEIKNKGVYEDIPDIIYIILVYITGKSAETEIHISGLNTYETE